MNFRQHFDDKGLPTHVTAEGPWDRESEISLDLFKVARPGLLVRRGEDTVEIRVSNGRATYRVVAESNTSREWRGSLRVVLVEGTIE